MALVASRYARALVDLVTAQGAVVDSHKLAVQMAAFHEALALSPELRNILLSPAVAAARKRAVVGRIGEMLGLAQLVRNFLYVVIDHRRVGMLDEIRAAFETALDEQLGLVRADVTSAAPLSGAEEQAIAAQIARLSGKRVRARYAVDGALIGGAAARVGSTIYDGSVRGQLQALRRKMTAE